MQVPGVGNRAVFLHTDCATTFFRSLRRKVHTTKYAHNICIAAQGLPHNRMQKDQTRGYLSRTRCPHKANVLSWKGF